MIFINSFSRREETNHTFPLSYWQHDSTGNFGNYVRTYIEHSNKNIQKKYKEYMAIIQQNSTDRILTWDDESIQYYELIQLQNMDTITRDYLDIRIWHSKKALP